LETDHFTPTSTVRTRFAGEVAEEVAKANMLALQNVLPPGDVDALDEFFKTRDPSLDYLKPWGVIGTLASHLECDIETKEGKVVQSNWATLEGVRMTDAQKSIMVRVIDALTRNFHQHIEVLPDKTYRVVAFLLEYAFKAGQKMTETLDWHQDGYRGQGTLAVFKDPRIHGAQLEVRSLDETGKVQVQSHESSPGQMLAFNDLEHRVNGVEVDNVDPESPAFRRIVILGIRQP